MARIEQDELGELLSGYLDGELNAGEILVVERLLREDATARHLLDELRRTVQVTASLPRHAAPASLLTDIQASLERSALLDDLPPAAIRVPRRRAPWTARLSLAAMLGLVIVGGWWFLQDPSRTTSTRSPVASVPSPEADLGARSGADTKGMDAFRPVPKPTASLTRPTALVSASTERLTVDQKLVAGVELAALQSHPFAAESVRLQLQVGDPRDREALAQRMVQRLTEERLTDLATERSGGSANAATSKGFYYRGAVGTNFEAVQESQILVRARPRQIQRLLDDVVQSGRADASAALVAGSLSVQGLQKTQAFIGLLGQSQGRPSKESSSLVDRPLMKTANGGRASSSNDWVEELLRIVGVDPRLVENPKPSGSSPPGVGGSVAGASTTPSRTSSAPDAAGAKKAEETADGASVRRDEVHTLTAAPLVDRRMRALEYAARESGAVDEEPLVTFIIQLVPPVEPPSNSPSRVHPTHPPRISEPLKSGAQ